MRCLNAAFVTAALLTLSLVMSCSAKPTSNASEPGSFRVTLTEAWTVYAIDVPELPEGEKYSRFTVISEDGSKLVAIPTVANRWMVRVPPWATSGTVSTIICGDGFCRPETYKWSTTPLIGYIGYCALSFVAAIIIGFLILLFIIVRNK